jgi:hypothetical protein
MHFIAEFGARACVCVLLEKDKDWCCTVDLHMTPLRWCRSTLLLSVGRFEGTSTHCNALKILGCVYQHCFVEKLWSFQPISPSISVNECTLPSALTSHFHPLQFPHAKATAKQQVYVDFCSFCRKRCNRTGKREIYEWVSAKSSVGRHPAARIQTHNTAVVLHPLPFFFHCSKGFLVVVTSLLPFYTAQRHFHFIESCLHVMPNSGDTLFQLECVLLFALDVVKGPYIHSCAPADPPEVIRCFLQSSATASAATTPTSTATTTTAGESHGTAALHAAVTQHRPDVVADDGAHRTLPHNVSRNTASAVTITAGSASESGGGVGGPFFLSTSPLLSTSRGYPASSSPQQSTTTTTPPPPDVSAGANSFTGPSSLVNATARATGGAAAVVVRPVSSSLLAQRRLLGLVEATTPDDSRGFAMGTSAPTNNVSVSEDNTVFAISPQTNLSESQHTLPSLSPMAGSFVGITNASMTSSTAAATANAAAYAVSQAATSTSTKTAPVQGSDDGYAAASPWMARTAAAATVEHNNSGSNTNSNSNSNSNTPSPQHAFPLETSSFPLQHRPEATTTDTADSGNAPLIHTANAFRSDSSSSPLATPVHTPSISASLTSPAMATEPLSVVSRRASANGTAEPLAHSHSGPLHATAGAGSHNHGYREVVSAAAGAAADDGCINSYSDVFVPRSEFCRRVLWLYPAESGLLFLYYAEDIPGEHYQRKTLRYSLCLVFSVDRKRMTIGAGLLHHLVRPYSVVLTNIAEELREAEVKYAYMSRGLQAAVSPRRSPALRRQQQQQLQLQPDAHSSVFSTPAPTATAAVAATTSAAAAAVGRDAITGTLQAQPESTDKEARLLQNETASSGPVMSSAPNTTSAGTGEGGGGVGTQKAFRTGRRRVVSESSARPDTYHLPLVERTEPATSAAALSSAANKKNANNHSRGSSNNKGGNTGTETAEDDTPTSFMSPLPPTSTGPDAEMTESTAGDERRSAATADTKPVVTSAVASGEEDSDDRKGTEDGGCVEGAKTAALANPREMPASKMVGGADASGSLSCTAASRTTTGTTPSSRFGTPFSPPAPEPTRASTVTGSSAVPATESTHQNTNGGKGGNPETSSTSAISPSLTVTPPSSLPMRSRAISQGGGGFQVSSIQSPALGDSLSTTTNTTAPSPMSAMMASSGPGGVAGPFPSIANHHFAKHPPCPSSTTSVLIGGATSTQLGSPGLQYRSSAGGGGGGFQCVAPAPSPNVNTLNAFITPITAPQWTPLSELVEELYRCLRCSGDGDAGGNPVDACSTTASATATSVPGNGGGGAWSASPSSRSACDRGGGECSSSSAVGRQAAAAPQRSGRPAGTRQLYSPLTTMLAGGNRQPSWNVEGTVDGDGELAQADGESGELCAKASSSFSAPAFSPQVLSTPSLLPPAFVQQPQQSQRGDFSVVHLSDRLSFHVRRMAPLQAARLLHFDHVPVPIVPYHPTMMEWMDMAVHHVFRLVDGVRTVADLVFAISMGTTTTLAEVYAEAVQRSNAFALTEAAAGAETRATTTAEDGSSSNASSPTARNTAQGSLVGSREKAGGGSSRGSGSVDGRTPEVRRTGAGQNKGQEANSNYPKASLRDSTPPPFSRTSPAPPCVREVAVPIDTGPSLTLLPGVRYSVPTSAAAAAAAAAISDGQAPPPNFVSVRIALATPYHGNAPTTAMTGVNALTAASPQKSGSPHAATSSSNATSATAVNSSTAAPQPHISVELPLTWVATTSIVVEALQHLELCHLLKIYRPWTAETLYTATPTLQRVLRSVRHPARHVLAQHLLQIAWMERQRCRMERQARCRCRSAAARCEDKDRQRQEMEVTMEAGKETVSRRPPPAEEYALREGTAAAAVSVDHPSSIQTPQLSGARQPSKTTTPSQHLSLTVRASRSGGRAGPQPPSDHNTAWLPATVTVPKASSVPQTSFYNDVHVQSYHASPSLLSSGALSLPRPPPSSSAVGGSGSGGGLDVGSNGGTTYASSVSTSCALSCSLKHSVCVGVAGKLQMNLTSSLPTSPVLRSGVMGAGVSGGGSAQRVAPGSHIGQRRLVDGVPSLSDPSYLRPNPLPHQHLYHLPHHHGHAHPLSQRIESGDESDTASDSTSSTASSSSGGGGDCSYFRKAGEGACPAQTSDVKGLGQSYSAGSSSSSHRRNNPDSRRELVQVSSPVSFKEPCGLDEGDGGRRSHTSVSDDDAASSASCTASTTSAASSFSASDDAHSDQPPHNLPLLLATSKLSALEAVDRNVSTAPQDVAGLSVGRSTSDQRDRDSRRASRETSTLGPTGADPAPSFKPVGVGASSLPDTAPHAEPGQGVAAAATGSRIQPAYGSACVDNDGTKGEMKRKRPGPRQQQRTAALRLFVPTDAELTQAAAATLCALAKFSNTSVASVQAEMRRMPVWAPIFNHWSDLCVRAMVEVAVLNDWLEDVSQ